MHSPSPQRESFNPHHPGHSFGFTLIEHMVVVAVIGVMASVALPQFRQHLAKAEVGTDTANVAGEKVKVAEAISAGSSDLCTGVPGCSATGSGVTLTGRHPAAAAADSEASTVVQISVADVTQSPIRWGCTVAKSPITGFKDDACDKLNP